MSKTNITISPRGNQGPVISSPPEYIERVDWFVSNGLSRDVDQYLIDICESQSKKNNEVCLIFDRDDSLDNYYSDDKIIKRKLKLEKLLDNKLFVGTVEDFSSYMSRWSYYDTITKTTNQSLRQHIAYKFITEEIGIFKKKEMLDLNRQVIFMNNGIELRLDPNLMIEISKIDGYGNNCFRSKNFYDPIWIKNTLYGIVKGSELERSLKISSILA